MNLQEIPADELQNLWLEHRITLRASRIPGMRNDRLPCDFGGAILKKNDLKMTFEGYFPIENEDIWFTLW